MNEDRCLNVNAYCICAESGEHEIHRCDCGGAWKGTVGQSDWWPVCFPGSTEEQTLATMAAMLPKDGHDR